MLEDGPLALMFYRGLWCPHCNAEIAAVQKVLREFERAGATVVGMTPQTRASQRRAARETPIAYRLLTDEGNAVAEQFGLRFTLPDDVRQAFLDYGIDLPAFNGEDSWSLPVSARYVIGPDRVIRYADVNPDHTVRPDPLDMLPAIAAAR
jgi:peroxiredoxin